MMERKTIILDGTDTGTFTGDTIPVRNTHNLLYGLFELNMDGGTGSVMLQGRNGPEMAWVNVLDAAMTTNGAKVVAIFNQMRAVGVSCTENPTAIVHPRTT